MPHDPNVLSRLYRKCLFLLMTCLDTELREYYMQFLSYIASHLTCHDSTCTVHMYRYIIISGWSIWVI